MEIWKDIKGYEGHYQVSNLGNVRSLFFGGIDNHKSYRVKNLKLIRNSCGYHVVTLFNNGNGVQVLVHRLVADAFIPNEQCLPVVDHINTITTDNRVENLRWVTVKGNVNNPISAKRRYEAVCKVTKGKFGVESLKHRGVAQFTKEGRFVKFWGCMSDAWRFYGLDSGSLTKVCLGKRKTAGGFVWRYANNEHDALFEAEKQIAMYEKYL